MNLDKAVTGVEELFREIAGSIALALEAVAALLITTGALAATYRALRSIGRPLANKREAWLHFAVWLMLGLEFALAADIVKTAISPGWSEIGHLGAIAAIRTFLNYFLGKDLDKYVEERKSETAVAISKAA